MKLKVKDEDALRRVALKSGASVEVDGRVFNADREAVRLMKTPKVGPQADTEVQALQARISELVGQVEKLSTEVTRLRNAPPPEVKVEAPQVVVNIPPAPERWEFERDENGRATALVAR